MSAPIWPAGSSRASTAVERQRDQRHLVAEQRDGLPDEVAPEVLVPVEDRRDHGFGTARTLSWTKRAPRGVRARVRCGGTERATRGSALGDLLELGQASRRSSSGRTPPPRARRRRRTLVDQVLANGLVAQLEQRGACECRGRLELLVRVRAGVEVDARRSVRASGARGRRRSPPPRRSRALRGSAGGSCTTRRFRRPPSRTRSPWSRRAAGASPGCEVASCGRAREAPRAR